MQVIEDARDLGLDELASTGYSNLAYLDVEQRRLADAERLLEESLAFTVERDIPICNHWQTGVRSRLRLLEGRWRAALEDAEDALDRSGMPLATFWPHLVTGLVHLRRTGAEDTHLEAAWQLADRLDEPLRRLPVLAALAERMWLTGVPDEPGDPHRTGRAGAGRRLARAARGPPATSRCGCARLGHRARPSTPPASPSRTGSPSPAGPRRPPPGGTGPGGVSTRRWRALDPPDPRHGCGPSSGSTCSAPRRRPTVSGASCARRVSPRCRSGPGPAPGPTPSGLTNRQLDVAKLVARGFTNAEIAERLFISPKTADHHVSAVLMKLGMPNRRAVVVQAPELGLA